MDRTDKDGRAKESKSVESKWFQVLQTTGKLLNKCR